MICGISTFLNYTMEKPCMDSLITFVLMCAVCGAYFCCLVRTKLSRLYDENSVNVFYDGPIRMHVPGITFNNHNWPHIVQVLRLSFCLNMILIPLLNLMASSIAVVAWKNIGKYVFLVIILCSTLLPIYVVGKKVWINLCWTDMKGNCRTMVKEKHYTTSMLTHLCPCHCAMLVQW